jgi:hypothetical protein
MGASPSSREFIHRSEEADGLLISRLKSLL